MIRKILIIFTIFVLLVVSTTPALAKKPTEPNGNGNPTHENQGNDNPGTNQGKDREPADPVIVNENVPTTSNGNEVKTADVGVQGFDETGYNFTARIFNGTAWDWCMEKVGDEAWCEEYLGDTANDHLIMKWNAEWDRGNDEGWSNPPYAAWENNQWNGKVPGGSGDVWHYKIVWVGACGADMTPLPNGGYCIWGQFEVIMDQGTSDGVHQWYAHALPNGYGSYP